MRNIVVYNIKNISIHFLASKVFDVLVLVLAFIYLFSNIVSITRGGVGYVYLLMFGALIFGRITIILIKNNEINTKNSFIFFWIFLSLVFAKILLDFGTLDAFSRFIYGTTGGIIFGYIFGLTVYITIRSFFSNIVKYEISAILSNLCILFILFIVFGGILLLRKIYIEQLRADILLIDLSNGLYQRPGNFISIIFIICSFLLIVNITGIFVRKRKFGKMERVLFTLSCIIYIVSAMALMLLAQLIGSNSGFVVVLLVCVMTLAFMLAMVSRPARARVHALRLRFQSLFVGTIGRRVARNAILLVIALGLAGPIALHAVGLDLSQMRITNFGQGGDVVPTSVTGRIRLAENFMEQWAYAPILGNLKVDELTTGSGSYAHSLPLSLLSHTGLLGFALFAVFFGSLLREMRDSANAPPGRVDDWFAHSKALNAYRILLLLLVTALASAAAFFTWMPFWFTVGLVSQHVIFRPSSKRPSKQTLQERHHGSLPEATP